MIFKVYLMRIGGRRRPWRDILNSATYVGDLRTVTEKRGDAIYTHALLVSAGALAQRQLPALYEPVLVTIAAATLNPERSDVVAAVTTSSKSMPMAA